MNEEFNFDIVGLHCQQITTNHKWYFRSSYI